MSIIIVFGYQQPFAYRRSQEDQSCNLGFRWKSGEDTGE